MPGISLSTNFFHARRRGRVKEEYGYRITVYDDDYVLGLRLMFVPLKASAQGVGSTSVPVTKAIPPTTLATQPTILVIRLTIRVIQSTPRLIQPTDTPIPATAMVRLITALIGARVDALRVEFIGGTSAEGGDSEREFLALLLGSLIVLFARGLHISMYRLFWHGPLSQRFKVRLFLSASSF